MEIKSIHAALLGLVSAPRVKRIEPMAAAYSTTPQMRGTGSMSVYQTVSSDVIQPLYKPMMRIKENSECS